jgi:hypothetical protein
VVWFLEYFSDLAEMKRQLARAVNSTPDAPELTGLLEPGWDLTTEAGFESFFEQRQPLHVTDRRTSSAQPSEVR